MLGSWPCRGVWWEWHEGDILKRWEGGVTSYLDMKAGVEGKLR